MFSFLPQVQKRYSEFFSFFARFFHERLRLLPNQVSWLAFFLSLVSAIFIFQKNLVIAFVFLFLSLIFDAIDGTIARKYNLETKLGWWLEIIFDRFAELLLFLALYSAGYITFNLVAIAYVAIIIMTVLFLKTKIDFGGKRIVLLFGPWVGFILVFYIITFIQTLSILGSLYKIFRKYV